MRASSSTRWLVLVAGCLGLFMVQVDTLALNLALPLVRTALGVDIRGLQWVTDVYNVTYASLLLAGGVLGDRLGRKRVFVAGLALFVAGSALCAGAMSFSFLVAGRFVQGVGAALTIPGTLSNLRVAYPDSAERARAMSIWAATSGVAVAAGPLLGGWLAANLGWQSVFLLNLPIGLIALWLALGRPAESGRDVAASVDVPGQVAITVVLASLAYLVIGGPAGAAGGLLSHAALGMFVIGSAVFLSVEARRRVPLIPPALFRAPGFVGAMAAASAMTFAMYGTIFVLGLYLETIVGASAFAAGLGLLPSSLCFVITSPLSGRALQRVGHRPLMATGLLSIAAALWLLSGLSPAGSALRLDLAMALTGIGMGLNTGPAVALAVGSVEERHAGVASGVVNLGRMTGATLGVAIMGAIVASAAHSGASGGASAGASLSRAGFVGGMHHAFLLGGLVLMAGVVVVMLTTRRAHELQADAA